MNDLRHRVARAFAEMNGLPKLFDCELTPIVEKGRNIYLTRADELIERAGLVDHTEAVRKAYEDAAGIKLLADAIRSVDKPKPAVVDYVAAARFAILARRDAVAPLEKETGE